MKMMGTFSVYSKGCMEYVVERECATVKEAYRAACIDFVQEWTDFGSSVPSPEVTFNGDTWVIDFGCVKYLIIEDTWNH